MKRFYILFFVVTMSIMIIGCNSPTNKSGSQSTEQSESEELDNTSDLQTELKEEDIQTEAEDQATNTVSEGNAPTSNDSDDGQSHMIEALSNSYFKEIEIEVEYADGKEFEAEIKQKHQGVKAEIEDDFAGKEIKGVEAFDFIFERVAPLSIEPSSDREDVAQQIIDAFELPTDYIELEVEVLFQNGTEVGFELKR